MSPLIHQDCRHFRGDVPCRPHKEHGVHCEGCSYYDRTKSDILIIKLGAIGDVIRTTPLLHRLKQQYPQARIWWLTRTPDILPPEVDRRLPFSLESIVSISAINFDLLINLDKDREACALAVQIKASRKKGFTLHRGICVPFDEASRLKYLTGLFDDLNRANTKSYPEEIFEMCGYRFAGEKYILPVMPWSDTKWKFDGMKKVVGLNTGCGARWTSRLWPDASWVTLARSLRKSGYDVVLLGGEDEHSKNVRLAKLSGARYFGHYPLQRFINLVNRCDLVVTAVTMTMHITIGLGKKIVLFNNIFNPHEFELYGLGSILKPDFDCTCYFSPTCPNDCMQYLKPATVIEEVKKLLPVK